MRNDPPIIRRFDSMTEFVDYAEKPVTRSSGQTMSSGQSWDLAVGWEGALDLARNGWSEGRPEADAMVNQIVASLAEVIETAFEPVHDVEGGAVDMAAFLEGEPECMMRFEIAEHSAHREVIRIIVSTTCSGGISASIVRNRGLAVAALVDLIARCGRSVELYCENPVGYGNKSHGRHTLLVKVKPAEGYLDIDQILFAIAHPAFQRRLAFSAQDQETEQIRNEYGFHTSGGYGGSAYISNMEPFMQDEIGAQVVVPTLSFSTEYYFVNMNGMVRWIREQLKGLGLLKDDAG